MTTPTPLLFVLADRPAYAFDWAAYEDIPRSRVRPITSEPDIHRMRGLKDVTYYVHESWVHAPLQVIHEVQHRIAWIRGVGGTVTVATAPGHLDPYRARPRPAPAELAMSEDNLKARVIDFAKLHGWKVVHYRPAKTAKGYRTPLEGDKGCPDLIMARDSVIIFAELKSQNGRVSPEQREWLAALGVYGYVWRPSDLPRIEEILT
jgi:hypothetical protein